MGKIRDSQKKIAVINDLSGFGRCSIAVELPIISAMKIQCCFVPTAVFSNHTGFQSFFLEDFTDKMRSYMDEWRKLELHFQGICTGFLGSPQQIAIVTDFLKDFKEKDTIVIVDPVMGDYGKMYPTYSMETCLKMRELIPLADIITPNLTEACILTGIPYEEKWSRKKLLWLAETLSAMGPEKVVITGIIQGEFIANYCYEKGAEPRIFRTIKAGTQRSGTGDIFASIIAADAVNGTAFEQSVRKAGRFIKKCILKSIEMGIPLTDGVCFEEFLHTLK
ncbi:MAG: pyridoxamine kinase [Lachnospiraceae bacterium]|nr:pyridoxamine kinase [Lachnospiraceae bacterium]